MYAGTYNSGVFRSMDGGRHWRRQSGVSGPVGVRSLAIDPSSPSTVYAGTFRDGIYKSTNGGARWRALKLPYNDVGVFALVVDPREPETVYAGTNRTGVFKTTDGGVTWTEMNAGMGSLINVLSLAIDSRSPKTLYAATFRQRPLNNNGTLFETTDGAANWRELKRGKDRRSWTEVAVDPRSSATVYALRDDQLFKSTNGGASWTTSKLPGRNTSTVAVDPRTSHLYLGMGFGAYFNVGRPRAPPTEALTEDACGSHSPAASKSPATPSRGHDRRSCTRWRFRLKETSSSPVLTAGSFSTDSSEASSARPPPVRAPQRSHRHPLPGLPAEDMKLAHAV